MYSVLASLWRLLWPKGRYVTPMWTQRLFPWWLLFPPLMFIAIMLVPPQEVNPPHPTRRTRVMIFSGIVTILCFINASIAAILIISNDIYHHKR
ncbi:MAG: hypothetical protein QY314_01625 [Candidatus Dojkabacteria bacterium]|nr:MAG: hypothetical protein QY314_01625 [Candidatus Dojkabacteria bacterium]